MRTTSHRSTRSPASTRNAVDTLRTPPYTGRCLAPSADQAPPDWLPPESFSAWRYLMWKRDEAVRPTQPTPAAPVPSAPAEPAVAPRPDASRQSARDMVNIGKSVVIKGDLTASEDLTIEGQVEGKIELRQHV